MNSWILSLISSIVRLLTGILTLAIYARSLNERDFATLAIALLIGQIVNIFLDAGTNSFILTSNVANDASRMRANLAQASATKFAFSLPFSLVYFLMNETHTAWDIHLYLAGTASMALGASIENYSTALKAEKRHKTELHLNLLLSLLIIACAAATHIDTRLIAPALLAPRLIALTILWTTIFKTSYGTFLHAIHPKHIRDFYYTNRHFSADSIASNLLNQSDGIAVSLFLGKEIYATYQPASRILQAAIGLGSGVSGVAIPHAKSLKTPIDRHNYLIKAFFLVGATLTAGLIIFLLVISDLLFGHRFQQTVVVTMSLALILLAKYIAAGSGAFLSIQGKQNRRAQINLASIILTATLITLFHGNLTEIILSMLAPQVLVSVVYHFVAKRYARETTT